MQIMPLKKSNMPDFLAMWKAAFGDGPEVYETLQRCFGYEMSSYVLTDDGEEIKSALCQIEMGTLMDEHGSDISNVSVSYAINTLQNARGSGYGTTITDFAKLISLDLGNIPVLCPANPELIDFYRRIGYVPFFYAIQSHVSDSKRPAADVSCEKIDIKEYNEIRESFLSDRIHVSLSKGALDYIEASCSGLYKIITEVHSDDMLLETNGIAAVSGPDDSGRLFIDEIILSPVTSIDSHLYLDPSDEFGAEALSDLLAGYLMDEVGATSCTFRMPLPKIDPDVELEDLPGYYVQAMRADINKMGATYVLPPYFGFPFD